MLRFCFDPVCVATLAHGVVLRLPSFSMACALEGTLCYRDGATLSYALKAWPNDDTGTYRWSFQRLLPFCGYEVKTHRTKVCNRWRVFEDTFEHMCAAADWVQAECHGKPTHSTRCKDGRKLGGLGVCGASSDEDDDLEDGYPNLVQV